MTDKIKQSFQEQILKQTKEKLDETIENSTVSNSIKIHVEAKTNE